MTPPKTNRIAVRDAMKTKIELDTAIVTQRKEALEKELHRIVATLIEKYQPEKVILFGSLATGRIHEWSDIDLLIIKESDERPIDRATNIRQMLNYPRIAIDIFAYTPGEVKWLVKEGSQFIEEILEQGRVLYEKAH